ncbi:MAG: hypothetical protein AAFX81_00860 [Pseudomonadota bacterium]
MGLLGQERAEQTLLRAHASGRLPHAWLFLGMGGIGKATLALRFARYLLAGGGDSLDLPADHPVARQVAAGAHPDLVIVRPKAPTRDQPRARAEVPIDAVRLAIDRLQRTAVGAHRVLVVDRAHLLNNNAANALLKLLEEPGEGVVIILTAEAADRFPPTIHSRVATLRLRRVEPSLIESWLRERFEIEPLTAHAAATIGAGSPGLALALAEASVHEHYATLASLLGDGGREPDVVGAVERLESILQSLDPGLFRALLGRLLRRTIGARLDEPVAELVTDEQARLRVLGRRLDRVWRLWDNLARLEDEAERFSLDRRLVLVDIATDLVGAEPALPA